MYSSKDYEKLWQKYQTEGIAHNMTLQMFCSMNNVPYNSFEKFLMCGYDFDLLAKITGKKRTVSSVRVKKFCATTEFDAKKAHSCGFKAPFTLDEGLARALEFEL